MEDDPIGAIDAMIGTPSPPPPLYPLTLPSPQTPILFAPTLPSPPPLTPHPLPPTTIDVMIGSLDPSPPSLYPYPLTPSPYYKHSHTLIHICYCFYCTLIIMAIDLCQQIKIKISIRKTTTRAKWVNRNNHNNHNNI